MNSFRYNTLILMVTTLLAGCLRVGAQASNSAATPSPARLLGRYVLTSTAQVDIHDPTAWRVLASNDGTNWVLMDSRTNEIFTARCQPRLFIITNSPLHRIAYNTFRLQIDAVKSSDVSLDMSVQLAGFDPIGPMINLAGVSNLQTVVAASCAHPITGSPEFAFDDDPTTSWWDYGLGTPGGCWLEVHYTACPQVLVTNVSQAAQLTKVSATRGRLATDSIGILSNLTSRAVPPRLLEGYALTSANDSPERDPRDWKLVGSNDGGRGWTVLDQRANEVFADRFERRVFHLTNAAPFSLYRLQISATLLSNNACQLAELEPIYASPQTDSRYSLVVSAAAENPPLESATMAFDGDPRSKWLCFPVPDPAYPDWLQWQLTPRDEDLPVIDERQLVLSADRQFVKQTMEQTNTQTLSIRGYALTSANDAQSRDPRDWRLLGSSDGGRTWDVLDQRSGEQFAARGQRREFHLTKPAACQVFRLQVDSVRTPATANSVQLGKIDPLFNDPAAAGDLAILVASQGENSPLETANMLFDGVPGSKWLDYAAASSNHSSWVEWRYLKGPVHHAIDLNRMQANAALSPEAFQLQLPATVLFADRQAGRVALGDQSGFAWAHLKPWPEGLVPGQHLLLRGNLSVRNGQLFVANAQIQEQYPLPAQSRDASPEFVRGSIVGRMLGVFSGPSYCGATLMLPDGSQFEARLPGSRFPLPPNLSCPIRMTGVIENLFAGSAGRIPSVVWIPDPSAIVLACESEEDWSKIPDYTPDVILPAPVDILGRLEPGPATHAVLIQGNTNRIMLDLAQPLPSAGTNVEAAGILTDESGHLVLHHVCVRPVSPAVADGASVLTQIADVQQFINHNTNGNAAVKIKGVITYIDLNMGDFYLQDGDVGLDVLGQLNAGLCPKFSEEGKYVELDGRVADGALFATSFVHVLGQGRMPRPAQPSWDCMLSGAMDNRWVEVEGTIIATDQQRLTLSVAGGRLVAWINELNNANARSLAGSLVRVRGVCTSIVNNRNQRLGVRLLVPSSECIELLSLAPEHPFSLPLTPLASVMSDDPTVADPQQRYVRTRGVVTCSQGRLYFLQDKTTGLKVLSRDDSDAVAGDLVEVVGRPQPDGFSAKLIQAEIKKVAHATLPAALPVDLVSANMGDLAQQQDATRVELEGVLANELRDANGRTLNMRNEAARQVFSVYLPPDDLARRFEPIPEGSRVRIVGIFKALLDKTPDVGQAATSFEVYANSQADITVLELPSWWTTGHTLRLLGIFAGILSIGLAWIWLLRKQVRQRTQDLALKVDELKRSELSLAAEVAERRRLQNAADQAHKQLVAVARQAGMAEVATGILHNVGNVLNSVNVSSTIVMDRLHGLRTDGLEKAVALLRQNQANLPAFLQTEKGQNLVAYMGQLSTHLATSQATTLKELESLGKNVQHIKDIVAVQQDYARVSGLIEKMEVTELVEDALRITAISLEQHKIKVKRNYDRRTPPVETDRHKVLQILVNVLQNATQACDELHPADKWIAIGVGVEGKFVGISVTDNGVGIAPENLARIFQHGFTTRRHGHGFGLHNAVLAAKEMGGSLLVESQGVGLGAKFTLNLPMERVPAGSRPN